MLPVVVSLEQGEAQVELEGDAADAPDVTGLTPSELQDHLGSSVVSGAHDLAVVLPVEGGGTKVNEADLRVLHLPHVLPLQRQVSEFSLIYSFPFLKLFINSITYLASNFIRHLKHNRVLECKIILIVTKCIHTLLVCKQTSRV